MTYAGSDATRRDFDRRLGLALRAYAADVPFDADPMAIARAAAETARSRRRVWPAAVATWPRGLRIALAVALLLAAMVVGLVLVGALRDRAPMVVTPPGELTGAWLAIVDQPGAQGAERVIHLNINWAVLLRDWEGNPLPWAGRAVEIRPTGRPGTWDLAIEAPAPCGSASYTIVLDDLMSMHVVDDRCAERVRVLTNTWTRPGVGYLVPRETYDMAGFSEPFRFVGPPNDISGGMPALLEQREPGLLEMTGPESWDGMFVDDGRVRSERCDSTSALVDLPATPDAVRVWLQNMRGVAVETSAEIPVDGRVATLFRLQLTPLDCVDPTVVSGGGRQENLTDLVYAIPTGDDTILFLVSTSNNPFGPTERMATDLVRTMRFDP